MEYISVEINTDQPENIKKNIKTSLLLFQESTQQFIFDVHN